MLKISWIGITIKDAQTAEEIESRGILTILHRLVEITLKNEGIKTDTTTTVIVW